MIAIGLDGFSKGWVAVTIDGNRRAIHFPGNILWLATQSFDRAAIDIPIGICDGGERHCDIEAREMLSPHGARVFGGARRCLFLHETHAAANRDLRRRRETQISIQLWGIVPKMKQVDEFARHHTHLDIRETHPELVFLRLNDRVPLPSKHTLRGLCVRRDLLIKNGFAELDEWLEINRRRTGAKYDDVLDACAAALAARDLGGCLPPGYPPLDGEDLPMQIWY